MLGLGGVSSTRSKRFGGELACSAGSVGEMALIINSGDGEVVMDELRPPNAYALQIL